MRGGAWNNNPRNIRSVNRNRNTPDNRNSNNGFRLAVVPPQSLSMLEFRWSTGPSGSAMERYMAPVPGPSKNPGGAERSWRREAGRSVPKVSPRFINAFISPSSSTIPGKHQGSGILIVDAGRMKRYGNLWGDITSFSNLFAAYRKAIKGKRTKKNVATFIFHAETELLKLQVELKNKTYCPGPYKTFLIYEKKKRLISSAPFRDRVVHHALCNIIEPIFEKRFIFDLYSNRKGKGVHKAVNRSREYARTSQYVLKCDIRKYFPSIDHLILKQIIRRILKCNDTLWLIDLIIDRSNTQQKILDCFPGDDLFTPLQRSKGLPIGNQTSQFFSNVYLSPLDHFLKETLGIKGYVRYVDDFLLFGGSKKLLWDLRNKIEHFLNDYRLKLKPSGVTLFKVPDGFPFLGYRIFPHTLLVNRKAILRFRRKAKQMRLMRKAGQMDLSAIKDSLMGAMGHFEQADSLHLRQKLMNEAWF